MSNLSDAEDALHSAHDFVMLVSMAAQDLQSHSRGPIMRGADAAREEIEKALQLINNVEEVQQHG